MAQSNLSTQMHSHVTSYLQGEAPPSYQLVSKTHQVMMVISCSPQTGRCSTVTIVMIMMMMMMMMIMNIYNHHHIITSKHNDHHTLKKSPPPMNNMLAGVITSTLSS